MGGDLLTFYDCLIIMYFNSHPRVGGDRSIFNLYKLRLISIRTPAWGVTQPLLKAQLK